MNLIKWEDNTIKIAPEAYGIKVIRDIWLADSQPTKDTAILELTALYFMYDPRSNYMYETDLNKRINLVKAEIGLPEDWQPNELFKAAAASYKEMTMTTSSIMLESNRRMINKVKDALENFDFAQIEPEKIADQATKIFKSIEASTKLMEDVAKAEKAVYIDVEEQSNKFGSTQGRIGDLGLGSLMQDYKEE